MRTHAIVSIARNVRLVVSSGDGMTNCRELLLRSVLEMVAAMKEASGKPLPYEFGPRRQGDIAVCYADPTKAREQLGWEAKRSLVDMCAGELRTTPRDPSN